MQSLAYAQPIAVLFMVTLPALVKTTVGSEIPVTPEPVKVCVRLLDDTALNAFADVETNDQFLVLRFSSPGICLRRRVPWEDIAEATLHEKKLSVTEFRKTLESMTLDTGLDPLLHPGNTAPAVTSRSAVKADGLMTLTDRQRIANKNPTDPRSHQVQSLQIHAEVANWDRDAAIDGIRLLVQPLHHSGAVMPVDGHLNVKLFGQAFLKTSGIRDSRTFDAFPTLGQWTQRVRKQDFGANGAVYQFRFHRTHPEVQTSLSAFGLTHARLSVSGQGTVDASDAMTQIRPFSVYRDWHQQLTGNRFVPAEQTHPRN